MSEELRQAVVFAARLEWAQQQFVVGSEEPFHGWESVPEELKASVVPLENRARVREYWLDVMPPGTHGWDYPPHWCGALCLFCIHRAELGLDVFWVRGFASRVLRQLGPRELPAPGDVAYFQHAQHHAIVEAVDQVERIVHTVDGNQQPGIRRRTRPLTSATAYYSLEPLLRKVA